MLNANRKRARIKLCNCTKTARLLAFCFRSLGATCLQHATCCYDGSGGFHNNAPKIGCRRVGNLPARNLHWATLSITHTHRCNTACWLLFTQKQLSLPDKASSFSAFPPAHAIHFAYHTNLHFAVAFFASARGFQGPAERLPLASQTFTIYRVDMPTCWRLTGSPLTTLLSSSANSLLEPKCGRCQCLSSAALLSTSPEH